MNDPASVYPPAPYGPYPPAGPPEPPAVVMWFKLYAAALALWNLLLVPMGVVMAMFAFAVGEPELAIPFVFMGALWILMGAFLAILFALPIFLKPRPWVWIYAVILIAVTMTSVCCLPAAIPLIIFWVREDNRVHHGMRC